MNVMLTPMALRQWCCEDGDDLLNGDGVANTLYGDVVNNEQWRLAA